MFRHAVVFQILAVLWLGATLTMGCAASRKIAGDIMTGGPELRKKVAILPTTPAPESNEIPGDLVPAVMANYLERNCADGLFILETPALEAILGERLFSPGGTVNTEALKEVGRAHGLSALIASRVEDLHIVRRKTGLWGFRDLNSFLSMTLRVRIYDTQTTAVVLDDAIRGRTALPESAAQEGVDLSTVDDATLRQLLFQIADEATEHTCETLLEIPWKGYITGGDGETFRVSAGRDVGLKVGDTLEVLAKGEPIEGFNERIYFVPGPKIGEVTVKEVFKHHSEVDKQAGENLEDSACLVLKP